MLISQLNNTAGFGETRELTSVRQRETDDQFGDMLGGTTPSRAALFREWCRQVSLLQRPRKALSELQIQLLMKVSSPLRTHLLASARPFLCAGLAHRKSPKRGHRGLGVDRYTCRTLHFHMFSHCTDHTAQMTCAWLKIELRLHIR